MPNREGTAKAQAKNRRISQTREHKRNARAACTLKSESLQKPERTRRNAHDARQAVVKVEIGKGEHIVKGVYKMDRQAAQDIIGLLESARRLASNAMTTAEEENNLWYQSYNDGRQQALYEAIAIIKSYM